MFTNQTITTTTKTCKDSTVQSFPSSDMVLSFSLDGIKRVCLDSSIVSNSLDSLKESVDSNMKKLQKLMPSTLDTIKQVLDKNNQTLNEVLNGMNKINDRINVIEKNQKLEWAIQNSNIGSFFYFNKGSYNKVDSTKLVKEALVSLRNGGGYYIIDKSLHPYNGYANEIQSGEQKFRNALSAQVTSLIGKKPRISMADNGYAIFYN